MPDIIQSNFIKGPPNERCNVEVSGDHLGPVTMRTQYVMAAATKTTSPVPQRPKS